MAYEMRISDWSSDVCSSDLSSGACVSPRCAVRVIPTRLVKHGLDVSAAPGGQALDQGRPVDVVVDPDHVEPRDPGASDDRKTVAGCMQSTPRPDLVRQLAGNAAAGLTDDVEPPHHPRPPAARAP